MTDIGPARPTCRTRALIGALVTAGALAVVVTSSAPPANAQEPPGPVLIEVCTAAGVIDIPELGPRTCASFEAGSVLLASSCNRLPLPPEACAALTDGRVVDPSMIDAYESTWVHRALRLQERLDRDQPLKNSLVPHTHNSSNSTAYPPSASAAADPNQRYTVADQLRMDIRGIELDLHWAPSTEGTQETGGNAVVLCHGLSTTVGVVTVHLACSVDRPLREGLDEIRSFLDAPGNEEQVVLLYLENQLDEDPLAHDLAARDLEAVLGDLVERPPPDSPCAPAPMETSRQDLLDRGKRVLIVGNCGPGAWGSWVFERGPLWKESGHDGAYPEYPRCIDSARADLEYQANWIRHWEDLTWVGAMEKGATYPVTPEVTRAMVACGVDMIGFDRLEPFDGRLEALVWSWAPDEPMLDEDLGCAARGTDGRFRMRDCAERRRFSCRDGSGAWSVPVTEGPWAEGATTCAAEGGRFMTPPTGWENQRLGVAAAGHEAWIPIGVADVGGPTPSVDPRGEGLAPAAPTRELPATGGSAPLGPALLLVGLVLAQKSAATSRRWTLLVPVRGKSSTSR